MFVYTFKATASVMNGIVALRCNSQRCLCPVVLQSLIQQSAFCVCCVLNLKKSLSSRKNAMPVFYVVTKLPRSHLRRKMVKTRWS